MLDLKVQFGGQKTKATWPPMVSRILLLAPSLLLLLADFSLLFLAALVPVVHLLWGRVRRALLAIVAALPSRVVGLVAHVLHLLSSMTNLVEFPLS